jgi:hypothetical protein
VWTTRTATSNARRTPSKPVRSITPIAATGCTDTLLGGGIDGGSFYSVFNTGVQVDVPFSEPEAVTSSSAAGPEPTGTDQVYVLRAIFRTLSSLTKV